MSKKVKKKVKKGHHVNSTIEKVKKGERIGGKRSKKVKKKVEKGRKRSKR